MTKMKKKNSILLTILSALNNFTWKKRSVNCLVKIELRKFLKDCFKAKKENGFLLKYSFFLPYYFGFSIKSLFRSLTLYPDVSKINLNFTKLLKVTAS